MARSWRQNVIVSHGGKHGEKSRTFRKGATVSPDAAAIIPDQVLGQNTADAAALDDEAKAKPKPLQRGSEPGDPPAAKALAKALSEERGKEEIKKEVAPPPPPPKPKPKKAESPKDDPEPGLRELPDPTAKRELALMRKADVEALAERHGIEVEAGTKGRTQMLRDLLAAKLNL